MNNDLNLYDAYHYVMRDYGVTIADFENGLRSIANIINDSVNETLYETVVEGSINEAVYENIMLSLGNDIEPMYPVSKFKTELDGKWIEDDGQKINEFLNQFKIIE